MPKGQEQEFHGVFPYLVSPINHQGLVKQAVLTRLCHDLIAAGVHGLAPLGSTGEFAYLNAEQRSEVVQTVVTAAAGRVPVVPGVASTTIRDAQEQARRYEAMGATRTLAIMAAYFPLDRDGGYNYFKAIAYANKRPTVMHHNPNLLHNKLTHPPPKTNTH